MAEGFLKTRGPMGFTSTGALHTPTWEEPNPSYVPPLVYAFAENRGSVRGSLRKIFSRSEKE